MEPDQEIEQPQKCVMCERVLAGFGILFGAVFLAIGIQVMVMSLRESRTVDDGD